MAEASSNVPMNEARTDSPGRSMQRGVEKEMRPVLEESVEQNQKEKVKFKFFETGRDLESVYVTHKYTEAEKSTLREFESIDYLPPHSHVYRNWLVRQPSRLEWDRWLMMAIIGVTVGLTGVLLHQIVDVIAEEKWRMAKQFVGDGDWSLAWGWTSLFGVLLIVFSSGLVVLICPSAGGSGIPELIAFLNGTMVPKIFNLKTMLCKFVSCVLAVASGMPVGPEGPMIHLGALIGAGVSQLQSQTLRFKLPFMKRFRNSADRRNFVSAGAAAGIASAFGAPVGGLLFAMEEVSSVWNMELSWQTFFCCMLSTFTTDLFNSAFEAFSYKGNFGLFRTEKYILFQVKHGIDLHIAAVIPTVLLGIIGGVLGAVFTFSNLKMARLRKRILSSIRRKGVRKVLMMLEPILVILVFASITVFLPKAFPCRPYVCRFDGAEMNRTCSNSDMHTETDVERYHCPDGVTITGDGKDYSNKTYNEAATLLLATGEKTVKHLFSRNTYLEFDYPILLAFLPIYFIMACWASGTAISAGLVVPMMLIGALYGRLVGHILVDIFPNAADEETLRWVDPGGMALIGAASFFAGVSRLTMSLTVIMIELTNDIQFLLLIMVAIMVAKWVGDLLTHPLYHAILELKCIPFLDNEPVLYSENKKIVNLELYTADDAMNPEVEVLNAKESVANIARVLRDTRHSGFPVIKRGKFVGLITRTELVVLLANSEFESRGDADKTTAAADVTYVDYPEFSVDAIDSDNTVDMLRQYCTDDSYQNRYLNLMPYTNQSAGCVFRKFSLHRAYILFKSLGYRHLTVIDNNSHVVGIITRKDLMGFSLEANLKVVTKQRLKEANLKIAADQDKSPTEEQRSNHLV